jgi:DNA polymerase III subunit epsilon
MPNKGFDAGVWLAAAVASALVLLWLLASAALVYLALPADLATSAAAVTQRLVMDFWPLLTLLLLAGLAGVLLLTRALRLRYVVAMSRLVERLTMAVRAERLVQLPVEGARAQQSLARAANALLLERDGLRHQMHQQVASASASIATERDQLATLMAELKQSVLVCNAQGRVLLYNEQAALQLSDSAHARVPMGIGRSVRELFDTGLVDHALGTLASQRARGAAKPSTEFVTVSTAGHMLRVSVSAVMREAHISGYVLMLQDVTHEHQAQSERDAWLYQLTDFSRASLASLKTAIETLQSDTLTQAQRVRWRARIQDDVAALNQRIQDAARTGAEKWVTRWPLQHIAANDFLHAAAQQIESWVKVRIIVEAAPDDVLLKIDSYSLVQALAHQSACLVDAFELRYLTLRVQPAGDKAQLDLAWVGQVMSTETAMSWELDPMIVNSGHVAMSVRDVITRHNAHMDFDRARAKHEAFFRWTLPAAAQVAAPSLPAPLVPMRGPSSQRPEFFDFDLFQHSAQRDSLLERDLSTLTYTVFDTEATGLNPSLGDEIIQIGAVRIVNAKLREHERMDQLVDPQRHIPAATIPIHGITQAMVTGQPTAAQVLPKFHAFAADSVLVAHNAAFDMRLLELKQDAIGLRFDQPVLDTLLLAAVLYPEQATHGLEALALRLGVDVTQRHNALADAMVTAQVWLNMLPMLKERGIETLGQAMDAAQQTYYARLKY